MMIASVQLINVFLFLSLVFGMNSESVPFSYFDALTSSGPVKGSEGIFYGINYKQYLGIPFATPPVGELRFQKPRPVEPWTKTLIADKMPPGCIQYKNASFPWYDSQPGKSEDCLYFNIWVPQSRRPQSSEEICLKPVIFFLYGGGFDSGSNRIPLYDARALSTFGDVVVVTVNYRLGAFGFFDSGTKSAPGNMAMFDILLALKWVNKDIAAFGGDPNQVTLAGQSVGAVAIGLLCVSPLASGLFKRIIMESGSPANSHVMNNTHNIQLSQKLAEAVGCADNNVTIYRCPKCVVKCMQKVDAEKIAKTVNSFDSSFYASYGDELLPINVHKALLNGNFYPVEVLMGDVLDEGSNLITTSYPDVFGYFGHKNPSINKTYGEYLLRDSFKMFRNPDAVVHHYLGKLNEDDYYRVREQVYTAVGDYYRLCPTVYFAESYSQAGNKVYYYYLTRRPSISPWAAWMGVYHFSSIKFQFGVPFQYPMIYNSQDIILSRRIIKIWTSFAKQGNPEIPWPLYSREKPFYVNLNAQEELNRGVGPHRNNCDFFRGYFGFP